MIGKNKNKILRKNKNFYAKPVGTSFNNFDLNLFHFNNFNFNTSSNKVSTSAI